MTNKLVRNPSVEWATLLSDTTRFYQKNLSGILIERMEKNEITLYSHLGTDTLKKVTKAELGEFYEKLTSFPLFDGNGKLSKLYFSEGGSNIRLDEISGNLVTAEQIFYIEKARPQIYVRGITTMVTFYVGANQRLGTGYFFSTSMFEPQLSKKPASAEFIAGITKQYTADTSILDGNLKQLYGRNFLNSLWPHVLDNKYKLTWLKTGQQFRAVNGLLPPVDSIRLPLYNETGNIVSGNIARLMIAPSNITQFELSQSWYYDRKKNRVFIELNHIILYTKDYMDKVNATMKIEFD